MHPQARNFTSPAALLRFYGVCVLGFALDIYTKVVAQRVLGPDEFPEFVDQAGSKYQFIPGWLHFDWVFNRGAVFGIAEGYRSVFVAVSIIALAFLTYLFAASKNQRGYQIILGMLLAGVLGNLWDRIFFGGVRDMIHALPGWKWPGSVTAADPTGREVFPYVFNVADVLLCTGVGLMLVHALLADFLFRKKPNADIEPAPASASASTTTPVSATTPDLAQP